MALTGSDDGYCLVEGRVSPDNKDSTKPTTGTGLDAAKLEEHNRNTEKGATGANNTLPNAESGEKTEVPSEVGAGILFGLSGLVLGGPVLALLGGVGATYAATKDSGPIGDAARAGGDFAIDTGSKVGEAAKEANEKHGFVDKVKGALAYGWSKVKQFDEETKASEKAKEAMSNVGEKTIEFERKHHFMENVLGGIQNGVNFLLEKVRDATGESCNGNSNK